MKTSRRVKALRAALAATSALTFVLVSIGAAMADPAKSSSASAYGLTANGLLAVPQTPSTSASAPPDADDKKVSVPLNAAGTLAINATLTAESQAHFNSDIPAALNVGANPVTPLLPSPVNTRGYARTEGLNVLGTTVSLLDTALVHVALIEAEAVAKCNGNTPQYEASSRLSDPVVAGINLGPLVNGVVGGVLNLLQPGGSLPVLSSLVSIQQNEVVRSADGISVNALHIKVLPAVGGVASGAGALEDVVVSHAEAHMPAGCAPAAASPSPGPKLALTGGGGYTSIAGAGLLMGAVLMIVFVKKWQVNS